MSGATIGIDLGTTNSVVAVVEGGKGLLSKGRDKAPDGSLPDTGKLRKKVGSKLGWRTGTDRLKPWK